MKIYKLCFACILTAFLMAGCSSAKDANESNFKAAAQDFLNTEYPNGYFLVNFPYKTDGISFNNTPAILHELARLGLVKETEISRRDIPSSFGREARVEIVYEYDITDEGKKFYQADYTENIRGDDLGGFAFGKATVAKIINFTEPTSFMGYTVSEVTYTYTVSDIPAWAKDAELLNLDKQLKQDVESGKTPVQSKAVFVLTDKGWIHEQLMK